MTSKCKIKSINLDGEITPFSKVKSEWGALIRKHNTIRPPESNRTISM